MSEIDALEKLRGLRDEAASKMVDNPRWVCARAEEIADEIEAEIEREWMRLPVDADGATIHVGDYLQLGDTRGEVVALTYCPSNGQMPWEWQCDTGDWYNTAFARHVKPRTLEDVLCDALAEVSCMGDGVARTFKPDEPYVAEIAAEIRAMFVEVDA